MHLTCSIDSFSFWREPSSKSKAEKKRNVQHNLEAQKKTLVQSCVSHLCPTVTLSRVSTKHFAMVGWAHAPPFLRIETNEWCSYQSWTKISPDLTKEWPAILAESFLIDQQSCQHKGGTNLSRWDGFGNHWEHLSSIHIRCSLSKPRKQWTCLLDVQYFWLCTYPEALGNIVHLDFFQYLRLR